MKHINESIIGRKGIAGISNLENHDIVKLDNDHYYMVILDEDEMDRTQLLDAYYKKPNGILARYEDARWSNTYGWYWQPLDEYGPDLKLKPRFRNRENILYIIEVYRSPSTITTKYNDHLYMRCDEENMKEIINKEYGDYKLLWKR